MNNSVFFFVLLMVGTYTFYGQNSLNYIRNTHQSRWLQKDWSDIGSSPYGIGLRTYESETSQEFRVKKDFKDSFSIQISRDSVSNPDVVKMPIYEPKGIYYLKIFEIDTTQLYYLKIYSPD